MKNRSFGSARSFLSQLEAMVGLVILTAGIYFWQDIAADPHGAGDYADMYLFGAQALVGIGVPVTIAGLVSYYRRSISFVAIQTGLLVFLTVAFAFCIGF